VSSRTEAIDQLEKLGVSVDGLYEHEHIDFRDSLVADSDVELLRFIPTVVWVRFDDIPITDRALRVLGELKQLDVAILDRTHVTSEGVKLLFALPRLSGLCVQGMRNIETLIERLSRHSTLESLDLSFTDVSYSGACQLIENPYLRTLHLANCSFSMSDFSEVNSAPETYENPIDLYFGAEGSITLWR
jgi:hypothetical protein